MIGNRKVLVAALIAGIAAFVPLNQHQADVLIAIVYAVCGANAVEHLAGGFLEKIIGRDRNRRSDGSGVAS